MPASVPASVYELPTIVPEAFTPRASLNEPVPNAPRSVATPDCQRAAGQNFGFDEGVSAAAPFVSAPRKSGFDGVEPGVDLPSQLSERAPFRRPRHALVLG